MRTRRTQTGQVAEEMEKWREGVCHGLPMHGPTQSKLGFLRLPLDVSRTPAPRAHGHLRVGGGWNRTCCRSEWKTSRVAEPIRPRSSAEP